MKWFKKGQMSVNGLLAIGMTFIATAIALAFGAKITKEVEDDLDSSAGVGAGNDTAGNVAANGTEALNTVGKWLPTLALVAVAAVIVSLVVGAFARFRA